MKKKFDYFKQLEIKLKKINKERLATLVLFAAGILVMLFLGFYFKHVFEEEKSALRKELDEALLGNESSVAERLEPTSLETTLRLREAGVERYFLSEVKLIDSRFTPTIHACLFREQGDPIYPRYVYETWSAVRYPEQPPAQIALMRYLLLPEDNTDFQPDGSCYIKEIETEQDWQELEEKYGFSRRQFQTRL